MLVFLFGIGVCVFCAVIAKTIATSKGRSGSVWFLLGLLFGPLSFIVAALPPPSDKEPKGKIASPISKKDAEFYLSRKTKKCPECQHEVAYLSNKCNSCGYQWRDDILSMQVANEKRSYEKQLSEGKKQCPYCSKWDVVSGAFLPDGSFGDWCPHCKKPA